MKTNIVSILLGLLSFFLQGCTSTNLKERADTVISKSASNKSELVEVLEHYKRTGEKVKFKAACYLIANMSDKYSLESDFGNEVWRISEQVLKSDTVAARFQVDTQMKLAIDSFALVSGGISLAKTSRLNDVDIISSSFLISNIELAFKVWELPWASHVSFEEFCEYILPYRIKNEPLSDWRRVFYDKFISFQDSVQDKSDPKQMVEVLSNYLYKEWTHLDNLNSFGFYPSVLNMSKIMGGTCDHRYFLVTAVMRSVGLPVSIDFTPQWTNYTGGHAWNVLLDTDGRMRPFNGGEDNFRFYDKNLIPMGDGNSICTKVYREMFGSQPGALNALTKNRIEVALFNNPSLIDVTSDYDFPKTHMTIRLEDDKLDGEIVYLATYNYGWELNTVGWGIVRKKKVDFQHVGLPAFYMPVYYKLGNLSLVHKPLVMYKEKEKQHVYKPDLSTKRSVRVYRKFAFSGEFIQYADDLKGARIQGSNTSEFMELQDLCVINSRAKGYEMIEFNNQEAYQFIRLVSSDSTSVRLAELEFWGEHKETGELRKLEGQIIGYSHALTDDDDAIYSNAFDQNIRSNFNASPGSWLGLDIGNSDWKPKRIWFLPRNNYNVIELGHVYELFYFTNRWVSLGKQIGGKYYLDWHNVPDNTLLLLKNHTQGRQERIFMYDNNSQEQVWW